MFPVTGPPRFPPIAMLKSQLPTKIVAAPLPGVPNNAQVTRKTKVPS
jgi:hypothetical protein